MTNQQKQALNRLAGRVRAEREKYDAGIGPYEGCYRWRDYAWDAFTDDIYDRLSGMGFSGNDALVCERGIKVWHTPKGEHRPVGRVF